MSSNLCTFEPSGGVFLCSRCGTRRHRDVIRVCGAVKPGDALEDFLTSYGITKEWYTGFKKQYGLPPTCHCDDRKEWLNKTAAAHPTIENFGIELLNALKRK